MRFRVIYRATCVCLSACATLECVPCARVYDGCTSCDGPRVCRAAVGSTRYQIELSKNTKRNFLLVLRTPPLCGVRGRGGRPAAPAAPHPAARWGSAPELLFFAHPRSHPEVSTAGFRPPWRLLDYIPRDSISVCVSGVRRTPRSRSLHLATQRKTVPLALRLCPLRRCRCSDLAPQTIEIRVKTNDHPARD